MNSVIVGGFGVTLGKTSERLLVRGPRTRLEVVDSGPLSPPRLPRSYKPGPPYPIRATLPLLSAPGHAKARLQAYLPTRLSIPPVTHRFRRGPQSIRSSRSTASIRLARGEAASRWSAVTSGAPSISASAT